MSKYLEYFKGAFDASVVEKMKPENKPYVAYSEIDGVVYTVISEEPTSLYQMVDLGLSVKWADRNVGASSPEDNGLYFSWGNVDGHAVDENGNVADGYSFDSNTYSTTLGGQYTGGALGKLDAEHDAATVNMGGDWRMPTVTETTELVLNTDRYCIGEDGSIVADSELNDSIKLRSICFVKKGEAFDYNNRSNFIEITFAGSCDGSLLDREGLSGYVWTNYISSMGAHFLYCNNLNNVEGDNRFGTRYCGYSVRGVHA